eukprot:TRINITY_DN9687_c0_g1_i1.p1 TRINITY_DN9687_c0_g1~~TRINITY_DN9687_c0_g1_i1.p1  ORF type:complete len:283 (+),score=28.47 TRINITY_DN9687_c0_g1_i1:30-878(+)
MATKAIPPYIWRASDITKAVVYCGDLVSVKCKVERMTSGGIVEVGVVGSKSGGKMPKKTSFEECPACGLKHTTTARNCTSCGESMVYFPQPKSGWKSVFATRITKRSSPQLSNISKYTREPSPRDDILLQVTTSLGHFIYHVSDAKDADHLREMEEQITTIMADINAENAETKIGESTPQIFDILSCDKLLREFKGREEFIAFTALFAFACDTGIIQFAKGVYSARKQVENKPYVHDALYLRNCLFNGHYDNQVVMKMNQEEQDLMINHDRIKKLYLKVLGT